MRIVSCPRCGSLRFILTDMEDKDRTLRIACIVCDWVIQAKLEETHRP